MAIELVEEVLDHAPADLTPGEVLVLVAIAEATRAPGESRGIEHADMLRRVRVTDSGLRKALARLAARGIEVRVRLGLDKHGKPFYTVPGKAPTYRLPRFPTPLGCGCARCKAVTATPEPKAVLQSRPVDIKAIPDSRLDAKAVPQGRLPVPQSRQGGTPVPADGTTVPPSPSVSTPSVQAEGCTTVPPSGPVATVLAATNATAEEAAALVEEIRREGKAKDLERLVGYLAREGKFADRLSRLRDHQRRREVSEWIDWRATQPECEDGTPGGALERPDNGEPYCPLCRDRRKANA